MGFGPRIRPVNSYKSILGRVKRTDASSEEKDSMKQIKVVTRVNKNFFSWKNMEFTVIIYFFHTFKSQHGADPVGVKHHFNPN